MAVALMISLNWGQNKDMQKIAIVTGAFGNLGQAVVKKFISERYKVIGTVLPNDKTTNDISSPDFETAVADLSSEVDSEKFISAIIDKYGAIDTAILTAGGFAMGSVADTSTADIMKQYQLNFETAYNPVRFIFTQMIKQGSGRIFFIGARPGLDAKNSKGMVAYGLSKSLLFRLAELMNDEAKGRNVVTSVVVPSTIDTPANRKSMPDVDPAKWVKPEAIADVIALHSSSVGDIIREPVVKVYGNA